MWLRLLTYAVLLGLLWWGLRAIWRDWRKKFSADDADAEQRRIERLARNREEAKKPGVIELKQGEDGVFRPDGERKDRS